MAQVESDVAGTVWQIVAAVGDTLEADAPIVVVESMKMEIPVVAPRRCRLLRILVAEGDVVTESQPVAEIE